jgi:hypothetical protein
MTPLVAVLNQINPVHEITPYFSLIVFSIAWNSVIQTEACRSQHNLFIMR